MAEVRLEQSQVEDPRIQRKISLAAQRNTRVMLVRTNDTHIVLDIARQADRAINYIRRNLLIRFDPEKVIPLLKKYNEAVQKLHEVAYELCRFTGIQYRIPRGLQEPLDEETKQAVEEFKAEERADLIEEMAMAELGNDGAGDGKNEKKK